MLPQLTFVLGGAASGKSAFAEHLLGLPGLPRSYIATAEARDDEMAAKVAAHQLRRGSGWEVVEAPLDLAEALGCVIAGKVVLVDCATMWLSNQMAAANPLAYPEVENRLLRALESCASPVIIVSNELGQGVVPENALARLFRQTHGEMNQRLAARAGLVVLVTAGLGLALKGALPKGAAPETAR